MTPTLSDAVHVTVAGTPAASVSPPLGSAIATVGATMSSAEPELVSVSAMPLARIESTPPGCHTALMRICELATLSHVAFGATPVPVSVQYVRTLWLCSRASAADVGCP